MKPINKFAVGVHQQGSTLLIVLMVLLLASVLSIYAVKVGVFEQRSSGNDLRAKLVQNVADAGLTQGVENVLANMDTLLNTDTGWSYCTTDAFPCGAAAPARRTSMMYYHGGVTAAAPLNAGNFAARFLSFPNPVATVNNGFTVVNGVGMLKCRLVAKPLGGATECATSGGHVAGGMYAVTLVSVAAMDGESARATAIRSFATNSLFPDASGKPPVMASGTITLRGNIQVVTNPNAAGPGVPVSVWTRSQLDANGTPDTCYQDEFYRGGSPAWYPSAAAASDQILRCDDCDCDAGPMTSGSGNTCSGGMDILGNPADCGPNEDVLPQEFPCDLFEHVFGVKAWDDRYVADPTTSSQTSTTGTDYFCESLRYTDDPTDTNTADGVRQIGVDEAYLAEKAKWIVTDTTADTFGERFVGDSRVITCAEVPGKSGLVWVRTINQQCGDGKTIGSPTAPVLFVHDGNGNNSPSFQNIKLFGLLFVRSTYDYPVCTAPSSGAACSPQPWAATNSSYRLNSKTGGTPELKLSAGSVIYGSAVVQGMFNKGTGTSAVVYNDKVLGELDDELGDPDVYPLPGSWTDRVQY